MRGERALQLVLHRLVARRGKLEGQLAAVQAELARVDAAIDGLESTLASLGVTVTSPPDAEPDVSISSSTVTPRTVAPRNGHDASPPPLGDPRSPLRARDEVDRRERLSARIAAYLREHAGESFDAHTIAEDLGDVSHAVVAMSLANLGDRDPHVQRIGLKGFRWRENVPADVLGSSSAGDRP